MSLYRDRRHAGRVLAAALTNYSGRLDIVVLALPRGGVPVAYEVARLLCAPLDVFVVRKLGVPGQEELAFGAIAPGGIRVLDTAIVDALGLSDAAVEAVVRREQRELARRERVYRGDRPAHVLKGRTAILVDDGLATGASMRAAVSALRANRCSGIAVAVPIAPPETCAQLGAEVDDVFCAATPEPFYAVGAWYSDFSQVSDAEVRHLLAAADREQREDLGTGRAGAVPA